MANEPEISASGIYLDTSTGQIVDQPPAEGVQIVAPGTEVTSAAKAEVERHKATAPVSTEDQTDPEPDAVKAPAKKAAAPKG